ncbi:glycerophosphodiester phosphodiesterase [Kytococcus sedentarius]|uniref:glycerophosphodiester phosphodiesterase n=1 Tax=Kytococcus sedentarius TaxID=1276 RepID=UPI000660BBAC|nr:glycerophosphodiester phosphodiesterase family protein [Kytococcus sedentarius]
MPKDPVIYQRRRDGGDVPGTVHLRRRGGGDIPLEVRRPTTPVTPAGEDIVARFLAARPFYISHRMGGTEYPEFTQAGLDASLRAGFKAIEVSVRRCASGEFVAIHDWKTTRTVPGTDYQIWSTPWSTLRTLRQAAGGFMRLSDIVDQISDDVVIAIDHKTTSSEDQHNRGDLEAEESLLEYLDTAFGGHPERRVLWKVFARGTSAARAKARGYRTMAMLYPNEVAAADLTQWDVLGMEWNAAADVWNALLASGRPTIAHIITNAAQARQALAKGAAGLMASYPSLVHP